MNLSTRPYFDDFNERANFSKILFKPGVAVQARELNQLQSILQNQIQRFGDNILKQGTIVSGGQITHHPELPYVKINDVDGTASAVDLASYMNKYVRNSAGTKALIVAVQQGLQSTAPDLNTLYVKYLNGGNDGTSLTFAAGQTLTVYDPIEDVDLATVTVAAGGTSPIGNGYGLTIDEGVIYHSGYFTRIEKQLVIVTRYSNVPNQLCVGFDTTFEIVTADDDASLYDNSAGYSNANAPGADRLKATAAALVLTKAQAAAQSDFLSIVEFTDGEPYKLDTQTQYNVIEHTLARRTSEESGDYVVDQFNLNTKSVAIADEPDEFNIVVDPGVAYVGGYRVATERNYTSNVAKATETKTQIGVSSGVEYGNYIIVERITGSLTSLIGSTVNLNDTLQSYSIVDGTITIAGGTIGKARVRGVEYVGFGTSIKAKIYLFDVQLNAGYTFASVNSVNFTNFSANLFNGESILYEPSKSTAIFEGPARAIKTLSNVVYTQQKADWGTVTSDSSGEITLTLSGTDEFEYSGTLTRALLNNIFVAPEASTTGANGAGTVATTSGSANVVGSSTTFTTTYAPGDYILIDNTVAGRINSIANNTFLTIDQNAGSTGSGRGHAIFYPKRSPVRIIDGSVEPDGQTMTLHVINATATANVTAIVPVRKTVTPAAKTVNRNVVARLNLNTHAQTTAGPWALGHADAIHLRGVFKGANTTFTSASADIVDVTNDFYIDANHSTDYVGTSYLYKRTSSTLALSTADRLLVVFDILTTTGTAFRSVTSYPINDGVTLAAANTTLNTVELPEVFGPGDQYYDVRDCIDFRPVFANTIAVATAQSTAAINPSEPAYDDRYSSIGLFAAPHSSITADVEYYLPRRDRVVINRSANVSVVSGQAGSQTIPAEPADVLTINTLAVPPYPSLPNALSNDMATIADTRIANEKTARRRLGTYTISTLMSARQIAEEQPRGYKMTDIGRIDRRLANVEYYLALNLAETRAQNRQIPSGNDANTDRFKFGFFVDSFVDSSLADLAHPQYRASIAEGVLKPRTDNIVIRLDTDNEFNAGGLITLPYVDYVLVEQLGATDGEVDPPVVPIVPAPVPIVPTPDEPIVVVVNPPITPPDDPIVPPTPAPTPITVVTQSIANQTVRNNNSLTSMSGSVYEDAEFFLSSLEGPVAMYFNFKDHDTAIDVYQGTTPGFTPGSPIATSSTAEAMSSFEQTTYAYGMGNHEDFDVEGTIAGKTAVEDSGKLEFDYNPAAGQYIKIRIYKFKKSGGSAPRGFFIYRLFFPIDSTQEVAAPTLPTTFGHRGIFASVTPLAFRIGSSSGPNGGILYYTHSQSFRVKAVGLKPSTAHTLWVDNTEFTSTAVMVNSGSFVTDAAGTMEFDFYYDGGALATSQFTYENLIAAGLPGAKVIELRTSDSSSGAIGLIGIPSYVNSTAGGSGGSNPPAGVQGGGKREGVPGHSNEKEK